VDMAENIELARFTASTTRTTIMRSKKPVIRVPHVAVGDVSPPEQRLKTLANGLSTRGKRHNIILEPQRPTPTSAELASQPVAGETAGLLLLSGRCSGDRGFSSFARNSQYTSAAMQAEVVEESRYT
jgi:hypothetical protein